MNARVVLLSVAVAVAVGLTVLAIAYALLAIPFYALAQLEGGRGMNRPFIRDGIVRVALPLGILLGVGSGVAVGVWRARGGHLPTE